MTSLHDQSSRADILNRLKRAEGQLRGVQRMVEEGEGCLAVAQQLSAVRKALDSTYVRMTMCLFEQEMRPRLAQVEGEPDVLQPILDDMEKLLTRLA